MEKTNLALENYIYSIGKVKSITVKSRKWWKKKTKTYSEQKEGAFVSFPLSTG